MKRMFFDTETTDLITNSLLPLDQQPRIIELYAVILGHDFEPLAELETYLDPGIQISELITKITGIKPEQLRGQKRFGQVSMQLANMIEISDEVVAHNLSYDMAVVGFEFARIGQSVIWPRKQACTVEATEWIKGYRLNLSALHEHCFGEPFTGAHRARADVEAMIRCYKHGVREGWV